MSESQLPVARREGLVIQELPGEVLIYDLQTNKAHCLNSTAATVWKSCDGSNSVADISRLVADTAGSAVQEDLVWLAIDQLSENNLLENKSTTKFTRQNRREVIKKVGLAAVVALPLVTSLVAPKAAHAGSACAGNVCTTSADCASGCTQGCVGATGGGQGICS